ncbi:sensor histidine kinase [Sphaerisporangium siamense]|uniref:histidine kinase n=1 Tax=Sphaerisporangium siamense TaxID=795645 RepID=A0A7W7GCE8_9ACTN|nr:sensor histidine kinase [Sphaerisporangium siamense]MBB4703810.1 signal transduction histidine kinase [Sphaerisporangium siamense]
MSARSHATIDALEHLVAGVATATLALVALLGLVMIALLCLAGVGLLLAPATLGVLHAAADRERGRLTRWGPELIGPEPPPRELRAALASPTVRREVGWAACHATAGLVLGVIGMTLPFGAVVGLTFPLWWWVLPDQGGIVIGLWTLSAQGLPDTLGVGATGMLWVVLCLLLAPGLARLQAWPGRRLLPAAPGTDLALRVAHLTATRAAALDAHAAELRRIERSLHDGTQNRLVAVTVLLGALRRAMTRDPATAEEILDRAQGAAEQALAELRAVVRTILPPVLENRSLADALTGLAAACPIPCTVTADLPGRCAVSVEATAYFVAAEALTNIARHSRAAHATVTVHRDEDRLRLRVTDDGHGGADERAGSGLCGIRRRAEAHDGTFTLTSPPGGPTVLTVSLPCGA